VFVPIFSPLQLSRPALQIGAQNSHFGFPAAFCHLCDKKITQAKNFQFFPRETLSSGFASKGETQKQ
jgi:hypothetical protein